MAFDILTFGEALVEVMRTGIDQPLDVPGPFEGPYPSGSPFIFAVQAARLNAKAACIGCIGDDAFGRNLLNQLTADGVATEVVRVVPGHTTGVAFVSYSADGSRDFVYHMRHAAAGQLSPEQFDPVWCYGLRAMHVSGPALLMNDNALALGLELVEQAQRAGAKISFDPNIRPQLMPVERARPRFEPFTLAADVIFASDDEIMGLTNTASRDAALRSLLGQSAERIVVLHEGSRGCTVCHASGMAQVPGFAVEEVDPTGAGDCFDAGFLVRWLEGAALSEAARFANACGALAVTARGPMAGAKMRAEVEAFMQKAGN